MSNKIAILRGINVGGKRKILMADLIALCKKSGLEEVKTYIQSGNVIFKSPRQNAEIEDQLEKAIAEEFGFEVPVIVSTHEELEKAIDKNPFYNEEIEITKLHLTFLNETPLKENQQKTESYNYEPDKFLIDGKDVFIYCDGKYHESKLTNNFFEKKLKVRATTRNWKTVLKLLELSS